MTAAQKLILLQDFLPLFRIGDKVRLKSGGPSMTVTDRYGDEVEVKWFDKKSPCQAIYPSKALKKVR